MKFYFALCFFIFWGSQTENLKQEEFRIDRYSYSLITQKKYLHDDDLDATYFVVHKTNDAKSQCSSFYLAKRGDSVFIKGEYKINKASIQFKTIYFYKHQSIDSTLTTFVANKSGDLILKEVIQFTKGKKYRIEY